MHYVYLLRSINNPLKKYIGETNNLKKRITTHNRGDSPHTKSNKPWALEVYFAFSNKKTAISFEKYLKSGSGHAFAKKIHLSPNVKT